MPTNSPTVASPQRHSGCEADALAQFHNKSVKVYVRGGITRGITLEGELTDFDDKTLYLDDGERRTLIYKHHVVSVTDDVAGYSDVANGV